MEEKKRSILSTFLHKINPKNSTEKTLKITGRGGEKDEAKDNDLKKTFYFACEKENLWPWILVIF